jgi:hypothetical protein
MLGKQGGRIIYDPKIRLQMRQWIDLRKQIEEAEPKLRARSLWDVEMDIRAQIDSAAADKRTLRILTLRTNFPT